MSCYPVPLQSPSSSEDCHRTHCISRNHFSTYLLSSLFCLLGLCFRCLLGLILTYSLFGSSVPANIYPQKAENLDSSPYLEGSSPSTVTLLLLKYFQPHPHSRQKSLIDGQCLLFDGQYLHWRWYITKLSLQ